MKFFKLYGFPQPIKFLDANKLREYYYNAAISSNADPEKLPKWADHRLKYLKKLLGKTKSRNKYPVIGIDEFDLFVMGQKQGWKCAYTGIPFEFTAGGTYVNRSNPNVVSIDRIDSNLPYTKDNIELVTWRMNHMKGMHDQDTLELMARGIVRKSNSRKNKQNVDILRAA